MFKMRPAFAAVLILLVTSGSFWLPLAKLALKKTDESTKRRQQEGFELISKMVQDGSASYERTDRLLMKVTIRVNEVWRTDDRSHPRDIDWTPLRMANLAHDWVCRMGFKVPLSEGDDGLVASDPVMARAELDFKRVIWNPGITPLSSDLCAKVDRGMDKRFGTFTQKDGGHVWSTGHCVDTGASVGSMLNSCCQEVAIRAGEFVRVGKIRGELKLSDEYQLVLIFLLKPVR